MYQDFVTGFAKGKNTLCGRPVHVNIFKERLNTLYLEDIKVDLYRFT